MVQINKPRGTEKSSDHLEKVKKRIVEYGTARLGYGPDRNKLISNSAEKILRGKNTTTAF